MFGSILQWILTKCVLEPYRYTSLNSLVERRISYNGDPNPLIRDYLRTGDDPFRVDPPIGPHGQVFLPEPPILESE